MTTEQLNKIIKDWKKDQESLSVEEKEHNIRHNELISQYIRKYGTIPFQMPYDFDDLVKAIEENKPFEKWDKYKAYYEPLPDGAIQ